MKCRIVFTRSAEKELAKISSDTQLRIGRAIRALEDDPIPSSSKRLKGREEFRLRIGDYRVLYVLQNAADAIALIGNGECGLRIFLAESRK